jgi:hypothetical protein
VTPPQDRECTLLEAVEYVTCNPSPSKRLADRVITDLLFERSCVNDLDLRAGLYLCIREAVRGRA